MPTQVGVELGIRDPVGITFIPVFWKDMDRNGDRLSRLFA